MPYYLLQPYDGLPRLYASLSRRGMTLNEEKAPQRIDEAFSGNLPSWRAVKFQRP